MKPLAAMAIGAVALAVAVGAGYQLGRSGNVTHEQTSVATGLAEGAAESAKNQPKLLYYRNPMGLPDTSPTPKKDPMGMDYIAVFEGASADEDAASPNQVNISTQKVQKLGVRSEAAELRSLDRTVRAAGRVEPDERRMAMIAPKFEGYVERLHVNVTGQPVAKGQPLFEVYSPELVSAQREYAIAVQGAASLKGADSPAQLGMGRLVESSLQRLKNWDISEEQIKALVASGETKRTVTFRSPVSGVVTEKKAVQGMRFMPGEALYQVSDLSAVWVVADVFEQDLGQVKTGAKAQIKISAYPEKLFNGRVTYVYPTLNADTRTVPVRVELANPGLLLKPGMFAQMELQVGGKAQVVTVPVSAVIDSGTRQVVLIQLKEGRFEPREVKLGARSDTHVEVLSGVKEGEQVVVAANFLIDAESNLKAAIGGFGSTVPNASQAASGSASAAAASGPTALAVGTPAATSASMVMKGAGHQANGTIEEIDSASGTVVLRHDPIPSLKWPAMTMEFKVANGALLKSLKPGAKVAFEFVERGPGEWVITGVKPAGN
jgi:Cu(I)/Ag(I) efflux system membrane fusion protein